MTVADITSRTVLLTGPSRGLGLATAQVLAAVPGVRLVLLGRPGPGLDAAVAGVRAAGADTHVVPVDLASLEDVRGAAAAVRDLVATRRVPPPDAVVANAGLQLGNRLQRSADGYELTFAVNVLAQYQLVAGVLPALAPGAHVLLLGSGTHTRDRSERLVAHPRWQDPEDLARAGAGDDAASAHAGQEAYATSKLAVNHLAHELDRRLGDRLRVNVYDPGLMPGTGLARDMTRLRRLAWAHVMPHLRLPGSSTPGRSGRVLAELALGRRLPDLRAGYVDVDRVSRASAESHDPARERRLWEFCEQVTGTVVPAAA